MSVSTTAYSVDAKTLKKLRDDEENFALLFEDDDSERYEFDSNIEFYVSLFRRAGLETAGSSIDSAAAELEDFDGNDVWFVAPRTVKKIVAELAATSPDELKTQATDRHGATLAQDVVHEFIDQIDDMKKFFNNAAEQGHSLIFSEG